MRWSGEGGGHNEVEQEGEVGGMGRTHKKEGGLSEMRGRKKVGMSRRKAE